MAFVVQNFTKHTANHPTVCIFSIPEIIEIRRKVYKTRLNLIYDPTAAIISKNHTFSKALYGDILHRISPKSIKKYWKVQA